MTYFVEKHLTMKTIKQKLSQNAVGKNMLLLLVTQLL